MNFDYTLTQKTNDASFVIINLLTFRIFLHFPSIFFTTSKNGAFLSSLWSGALSFAVIFLLFWLYSLSKEKNLVAVATFAFGKFGGLTARFVLSCCLFLSATSALSDISGLSKMISFPTAPIWFIILFFVLGGIFGAFGGLSSLVRMHGLFVPLIALGLVFLTISLTASGDFGRLFPIFGKGPRAVFGEGLNGTIMYTDILLLFLIEPPKDGGCVLQKKFLLASGAGIGLCVLFVLSANLSLSGALISEDSYPFYLCLKEVFYGRFFQRIDAVMQFLSAISVMLYLSLNAALFSEKVQNAKTLQKKRTISAAYLLLVAAASLVLRTLGQKVFQSLVFIFGCGGIMLLLITLLFAKKEKKNEKT